MTRRTMTVWVGVVSEWMRGAWVGCCGMWWGGVGWRGEKGRLYRNGEGGWGKVVGAEESF